MSNTGTLTAARAAVDIIPNVDTAALAAGVSKATTAAMAELSAAADQGLAARLGAAGSGLSKIGTAFAPLSKAALGFGAVAVASAVSVDNAYASLAQRTGATGAALGQLEQIANRSALSTGASFKQVAEDEANLTQRLNVTGPALQALTTQFENLRYVQGEQAASVDQVSAVLAQFGEPVSQAGKAMDELFVASQRSGVGTATLAAELQSQGAVLRDIGLDYTQATALLATLGKAGIPAQAVMVGLRTAFRQAHEAGEPLNQFFAQTVKQIQDLVRSGDTVGAEGLAAKVFGGRGAATIFDAIKQGKLDATDMTAALSASGGAINRTAQQTETFARELGKVKDSIELGLKPLGDQVLPKVEAGMRAIGSVVGGLSHVGGGILGDIGGDALVAAAATSAVLKLGGAIATMSGNRVAAFNTLTGYTAATQGATAAEATFGETQAASVAALRARTAAQADLDAALAAYGPESAEAAAATAALATAEAEATGAAASAAAADEELAAAEAAVATTAALAAAALGTVATAVVAGFAGFEVGTQAMHALESAVNGPATNVSKLTHELGLLATQGRSIDDLDSKFSHLGRDIHDLAGDNLAHRILDPIASRFNTDKAKDELKGVDSALADLARNQGPAVAEKALEALASQNGLTTGTVIAALAPWGQFGEALRETNAEKERGARASGYLSNADRELATQAKASGDALIANEKAVLDLSSARLSATEAASTLADAQTTLNELTHGYPASSEEAKQASSSYASALDSERSAIKSVHDAQANLNDVIKQGAPEEHSLTEALQQAKDEALNAADAVASAQDNLDKLQAHGADHHDIAAAQRQLAEAQRAAAEADTKRGDAAQNLADEPAKQAAAVQKAQQQIVDAEKAATKATSDLADAAHQLDLVLHGRPATDKQVKDASDAVARATLGVQNADLSVVGAIQTVNDKHAALATTLGGPNGSNAALLSEVDALKKIELQAPETKSALDPLIAEMLQVIDARNKVDAALSTSFGSGTLDPSGGISGGTGTYGTPGPGRGPQNPTAHRLTAAPDHLERMANTLDRVATTLDTTLAVHQRAAARPRPSATTRVTVDPFAAATLQGARFE